MTIRQHAYFAIRSETVSAEEVENQLGVTPDEVIVRGSRQTSPPIPRFHAWKIVAKDPDDPINDQIATILERLAPHRLRLRQISEQGGNAVLQVVRVFDIGEAAGEPGSFDGSSVLGLHVDESAMRFLASVNASFDVDEDL